MTPDEENALVSMARPLGATNASRDAIRLAIRAAYAQGREDAAKVCEGLYKDWLDDKIKDPSPPESSDYAAAIRKGE